MTTRIDLYTRVTNAIIADLEKGVRPWLKPWNAEHAAGRITRPLRAGGQPYKGINVLMLWASAMTQDFAAPIWMTLDFMRIKVFLPHYDVLYILRLLTRKLCNPHAASMTESKS